VTITNASTQGVDTQVNSIDPWYLENLVCPIDHSKLYFDGQGLVSKQGRRYPVVDGMPVMLAADEAQTIGVAHASIARARGEPDAIDRRAPQLYLESLGISEEEKAELVRLYESGTTSIDPVAMMLIGATCGNAYKDLIGNRGLIEYPIPSISLTPGRTGDTLLDVGCNWGRWSAAAARQGFSVVGIDPSLGAVMAARRIAKDMGLDNKYLVADGRFLPFRDNRFKAAYSYSVLQHFSKENMILSLMEIRRVLRHGGRSLIQMPNRRALRSLLVLARRGFAEGSEFEVRYYSIGDLLQLFSQHIGRSDWGVDCFLGLNVHAYDRKFVRSSRRLIIDMAEALRWTSDTLPFLRNYADSIIVNSVKHN